jgi:hypothetical protein
MSQENTFQTKEQPAKEQGGWHVPEIEINVARA